MLLLNLRVTQKKEKANEWLDKLDFYFKNTLIEVKFDRELEGKQKTLFDEFSTQNKIIIIQNIWYISRFRWNNYTTF